MEARAAVVEMAVALELQQVAAQAMPEGPFGKPLVQLFETSRAEDEPGLVLEHDRLRAAFAVHAHAEIFADRDVLLALLEQVYGVRFKPGA